MSTPTPPMPAPRIVPVIGSKGGTGRTTTVVLLAAALARQGHRVAVLANIGGVDDAELAGAEDGRHWLSPLFSSFRGARSANPESNYKSL